MTAAGHRLGVDVGGTKIEIVALADDGAEAGRIRVPTPAGSYEATIGAIVGLIAEAERRWGPGRSIGVGTPGAIDPVTGLLKNSNSTVLNGRPFGDDLVAAAGRTLSFANDADCLALSEWYDGAAAESDPVFGVILGTGVGGGIVTNGGIVRGANARAGEWGHTPLPGAGADGFDPGPCWCGRPTCVETFLSGSGLSADFEARTGRVESAARVAALAGEGDRDAVAAIEAYATRLGRALAMVINIVDPEVIVVGGGLSNIDALYARAPAAWASYVFGPGARTRMVKARHGDSSGARGAARLRG